MTRSKTKAVQPTPGPWSYDSLGSQTWILGPRSLKAHGKKITVKGSSAVCPAYLAEIITTDDEGMVVPTEAERTANAQLMASAPDLLAAAKRLIGVMAAGWAQRGFSAKFTPDAPAVKELSDAIDKAEGV